MNYVHSMKPVLSLVVFAMLAGCNSKADKPAAGPGPAPAPGKTVAAPAAPQATPKEQTDARAAAARVLEQFKTGAFAAIYRESEPSFKQIGPEVAFVVKFQQTREKTGELLNPREISFVTRPGIGHVIVYRLENKGVQSDLRMTFTRSKDGKMLLAGINQHDTFKK